MGNPDREEGITIVLLCMCSSNISSNLDIDALRAWLKNSGKVDITLRGNLLCSPAEKALLDRFLQGRNAYIRGRKIKSIVVAACSPKQHEATFREIAVKNGINLGRVQMANIREQCAWVTRDKEEATAKAIRLIDAALSRGRYAEELKRQTIPVLTSVMVVGGGIAGIQTALALSRAGRRVYLVEREISLGGEVIKTEEVAPSLECSPCMLAPLLSSIRDDSRIKVIANAEIKQVTGFFGRFGVVVKQKARFVQDSCIACEECFDECPVEVDHTFHYNLGRRKAIYGLFAGSVPAAVAIDKEHCLHFLDDSCNACQEVCPFQSVNFKEEDTELNLEVGSIVLATGFSHPGKDLLPRGLGYGELDNVYTSFEFERFLSTNGPSGGELHLKEGGDPASLAVIHCAGSLSPEGIPYCSGMCCVNALKHGAMLRKIFPDLKVYNIHNDLVFPRPEGRAFYMRQKAAGTVFYPCPELASLEITRNEESGKLRITGSGFEAFEVDLVVLATGILPPAGTGHMAELLNLDLDDNGFFSPDHSLLHQTGTVLDGVYAAGCSGGPCDAAGAVTRGHAAAGDILSKLVPGRELELEIMTSVIDPELCAGCKLCIPACPYKAITFDSERGVSVVNEVICRGCGTCTAACPSGASRARHFSGNQIRAEVGGLLNE